MAQDIQQIIIQEARAHGLDPACALAVAVRESSFRPEAKASKTIRGIFQMSGPLREKYGQGDSTDPAVQTRAFAAYTKDLKADMGRRLGRPPTNNELYLGHHFGPARAARMASGQIAGETPVDQVFTPNEMAVNPHFAKAGTTGALTSGINADMDKRGAKFGKMLGDAPPRPPADVPPPAGQSVSQVLPGVAPGGPPAASSQPGPQGLPGIAPAGPPAPSAPVPSAPAASPPPAAPAGPVETAGAPADDLSALGTPVQG